MSERDEGRSGLSSGCIRASGGTFIRRTRTAASAPALASALCGGARGARHAAQRRQVSPQNAM